MISATGYAATNSNAINSVEFTLPDGRAFTTLAAPAKADPRGWKLQPDDLWFVGPPDAGVVFRF